MQCFCALSTQWRAAPMGGLMGLDYAAIAPTLRLMRVKKREWAEIFDALRVMEAAALEVVHART